MITKFDFFNEGSSFRSERVDDNNKFDRLFKRIQEEFDFKNFKHTYYEKNLFGTFAEFVYKISPNLSIKISTIKKGKPIFLIIDNKEIEIYVSSDRKKKLLNFLIEKYKEKNNDKLEKEYQR